MQFPYAAKGIKKVFSSVIVELIGAAILLIGAIITLAELVMAEAGKEIGAGTPGLFGLIVLAIAGIMTLVASIVSVVGLAQASKDEGSFKFAIFIYIAALVFSIVENVLYGHNEVLYHIISQIRDLLSMIAIIFVVQGVINLAEALKDTVLIKRGKTLFIMITVIYALSCLANIIVAVFGGYTASTIAAVIAVIADILATVQLFVYISYLAKAKKMLNSK